MNPAAAVREESRKPRAPKWRQCVLLVEQDFAVRDALSRLRRREGYHTLPDADGAAALAGRRGVSPNLIRLDRRLPGMDGRQFRQRLLRDPALAAIPVVVSSGADDLGQEAAALEGTGYLAKTAAFATRLETVRSHCG